MITLNLLAIFLFFTASVNSYKFLVVNPIYAFSHVKFTTKIADTLADSGHNVTLFQPFLSALKNVDGLVKNKNVKVINWYPSNFEEMKKKEVMTFPWVWDSKLMSSPVVAGLVLPGLIIGELKKSTTEYLQDAGLFEKLKNENFDAIITEIFDITGLYLGHLLNISSTIGTHSSVRFPKTPTLFGQGSPLGYIPGAWSALGKEAGFLDRLNDVYELFFDQFFHDNLFDKQQQLISDALGPNVNIPHWKEVITKATIYMTNCNPYLDFAIPNVDSIVRIGGFTMDKSDLKRAEQLPDEYDQIMSQRNQTVLMSFGSMVRSFQMPESYKSGVIQMFKNLPEVTFIWKYEQPEDAEFKKRLPSNVHLKKWVPQSAILADPRLSLFVTHGGLASTMELAYSGIPAIMIPVFADQPHNAAMLARHGGAIAYNKLDLGDSEKLTRVIRDMITNSRYKTAAVQLQSVLHSQPIDPKELLVKNVEFAVKFPKLKSQVAEIVSAGYIGYYYIDVFAFLAIVSIALFYLFIKVILRIRRRFRPQKDKSKPE